MPNNYMFKDTPVHGMTWNELQEAACHGALVMTKECDVEKAGPVYKLRDPCSEAICFVYTDEAEQFSNPFPTKEDAAKASRGYADQL